MAELPRAARLACCFNAWTAGLVGLDDAPAMVVAGDAAHDVITDDGLLPLLLAFAHWRDRGACHATAVLPESGDTGALGGPVAFNESALEAGEAVIFHDAGIGVVPDVVGSGVFWNEHAAHLPRHVGDVSELELRLREVLIQSARELSDLDVGRWRPEVADALASIRDTTDSPLPPGSSPRANRLAVLAQRCRTISELALDDDGAATTVVQAELRRTYLRRLDQVARQALAVAASEPFENRQHSR